MCLDDYFEEADLIEWSRLVTGAGLAVVI